jgi:hypothetical protein
VSFNLAVVAAKERGVIPNTDQLARAASDLRRDLNDSRGGLHNLIRAVSDLTMARRRIEHAQVLVDEFYSVCKEFQHLDAASIASNRASTPPPSQILPRLEPAIAN